MLKNLSLSILTALLFVSVSYAEEDTSVKIVSIDESPISMTDVAEISADWSQGNMEVYMYMISTFIPEAADDILEALPEIRNNKKALVSLTMGLVAMSNQAGLDVQKALMNISTHKYLVNETDLSLQDIVDALKEISA